jgi:hypothetical protein
LVPSYASIHWVGMSDVPPILSHSKLILQLFLLLIYLMWYCLMVSLYSYSSFINFNFGLFICIRIIIEDFHSSLGVLDLMKIWFDIYGFTDKFLSIKSREDGFDKIMRRISATICSYMLLVFNCFTWITMRYITIED